MLFGQPLQQLLAISLFAGNTGLPDIIRKFTTYLKTKADVEDIFSDELGGTELEDLRSLLENASESVDFESENPRQVAALFKNFIQGLPKPLIKPSTLTEFMISDDLPQEEVFYAVRGHLLDLPTVHLKVLQELLSLLCQVVESPTSKMTASRLGVAWATALFPSTATSTASEKESAAKLIGSLIAWFQLLFADLDVIVQRQAEEIKSKTLSRGALVKIWAKKVGEERHNGKNEFAVAITTTNTLRLLLESLCNDYPKEEEDLNNCKVLFGHVIESHKDDENKVTTTLLTAAEELGQLGLSDSVIESFCFLASILCKDFSSNTIQLQERNINMYHAMLTDRKQLDYSPGGSSQKEDDNKNGSTPQSEDGPVLLAIEASNKKASSPANSPRPSPKAEAVKPKPPPNPKPAHLQKAGSQPALPPTLSPRSSAAAVLDQKVFRSGWVLNSGTTTTPSTKPPKPKVRPKSTMVRPVKDMDDITPPDFEKKPQGKRASPRINVTTDDDGVLETVEVAQSSDPTPAEQEYEYEEVYEEVEEWEYEETSPRPKLSPKKASKPTLETRLKVETRPKSATNVDIIGRPSLAEIMPLGFTEEKTSPKPLTLTEIAALSSKLDRWAKLIELYLFQRSLLLQHTKVKDQIHLHLPEHVKTFQEFVKIIKDNNPEKSEAQNETAQEPETSDEEEEVPEPIIFTPRSINLRSKESISKNLQNLLKEKAILEKQLQIVNKHIQKITKSLQHIKATAISAIEEILVQAKGGFESTYLFLKASEHQNDNRCIDDVKEYLELTSSTLNHLKANDNTLLSKDQIDQKITVLKACYRSRVLLQKTLQTVRVIGRLGEQEQMLYQLQQLIGTENDIKKGLEDGGVKIYLDETEPQASSPRPSSLRSSTDRRATTASVPKLASSKSTGAIPPTASVSATTPSPSRDSFSPKHAKRDRGPSQMLSKFTSLRIGKLDEKTGRKKTSDDNSPKMRGVSGSLARYSVDENSALAMAKDQLYETLTSFYSNETPEEKEKRLRTEVIAEFISTETAYLKNLQSAVKYMYEPLKSAAGVVTPEEHTGIFANLPSLIPVTQKLLRQLQGQEDLPTKEQSIGNCFLGMIKDFEVYKEYCANQGRSQRVRDKLSKKPTFAAFIAEATKSPEFNAEQTSLDNLLIQPMQRICRYPLLLNELIKRTPEDHSDKVDAANALEEVSSIVDNINMLRLEDDKKAKLEEMFDNFDTKKDPKITLENFAIAGRELLLEGPIKKLRLKGYSGKGNMLLFNDLLILAVPGKKMEIKAMIPTKKCCVSDVRDNGKVKSTFEILNTTSKELSVISCTNDVEKKVWLQNIHSTVTHSLTNAPLSILPLPK